MCSSDLLKPEVIWNIEKGFKIDLNEMERAENQRVLLAQRYLAFFDKYDLLLTPTTACPPFAVGLDNPTEIAGRPAGAYAWIPFTYPFNLTGQPAASVPAGFTANGLPVGLQIVGRRFADAAVLRASAAFERLRPWAQQRPPIG